MEQILEYKYPGKESSSLGRIQTFVESQTRISHGRGRARRRIADSSGRRGAAAGKARAGRKPGGVLRPGRDFSFSKTTVLNVPSERKKEPGKPSVNRVEERGVQLIVGLSGQKPGHTTGRAAHGGAAGRTGLGRPSKTTVLNAEDSCLERLSGSTNKGNPM